jgi:hypothetical protein
MAEKNAFTRGPLHPSLTNISKNLQVLGIAKSGTLRNLEAGWNDEHYLFDVSKFTFYLPPFRKKKS